MNDALKTITAIYQTLRSAGLARSKAEFSTRWLLRDQSYLTCMQTRDRCPTPNVANQLATTLRGAIHEVLRAGQTTDYAVRSKLIALADALILAEVFSADGAGATTVQPPAPADKSLPQRLPSPART